MPGLAVGCIEREDGHGHSTTPKETEVEKATVLDVADDGTSLVGPGGRRLLVNPGDIVIACLWLLAAILELSDPEPGQFYNLSVKFQGTDQNIRARWET